MKQNRTETVPDLPEELAHRSTGGLDVVLLWERATNHLTVAVDDLRTGHAFELFVRRGENPLALFYHPFAYLGRAAA